MEEKSLKIYNDSVIKLSVKQGTETQRLADTTGDVFTTGELAFVRDTARVFVGDAKRNDGAIKTPGGTLVGNKYLGMIDTRNPDTSKFAAKPLDYSDILENGKRGTSCYKNDDSMSNELAEMKWDRKAEYNSKYDAYNGDFIYDKYQNAFILFDKNIVTQTAGTIETDYTSDNQLTYTPFVNPSITDNSNTPNSDSSVSYDNFGDGYVIFRNIIPDGITLRFREKKFNGDTGVTEKGTEEGSTDYKYRGNYNLNILEVGNIGGSVLSQGINNNHFTISNDLLNLRNNINFGTNNTVSLTAAEFDFKADTIKFGSNNVITLSTDITSRLTIADSYCYLVLNKSNNTIALVPDNVVNNKTSGTINLGSDRDTQTIISSESGLIMLKSMLPLGWSTNYTGGSAAHLTANLEFGIKDNNIFCNRKVIQHSKSGVTKQWETSVSPLNNPTSYFSSTDFPSTGANFNIWNNAFIVRGNNSYASLASNSAKYKIIFNGLKYLGGTSFTSDNVPAAGPTFTKVIYNTDGTETLQEGNDETWQFAIYKKDSNNLAIIRDENDKSIDNNGNAVYEKLITSLTIDGIKYTGNDIITNLTDTTSGSNRNLLKNSGKFYYLLFNSDAYTQKWSKISIEVDGELEPTEYTNKGYINRVNGFSAKLMGTDSILQIYDPAEIVDEEDETTKITAVEYIYSNTVVSLPTISNGFSLKLVDGITTLDSSSKDSNGNPLYKIPSTSKAVIISYEDKDEIENKPVTYSTYFQIINDETLKLSNITPSNIKYNNITFNEESSITGANALSAYLDSTTEYSIENAKSVILSVTRNYDEQIFIFGANNFGDLKTSSTGILPLGSNDDPLIDFETTNGTLNGSTFTANVPTKITDSNNTNMKVAGSNETKIVTETFEVPVINNQFFLRLSNINYGSSSKLILNLIGYRV